MIIVYLIELVFVVTIAVVWVGLIDNEKNNK
jgi:hypothetical protein